MPYIILTDRYLNKIVYVHWESGLQSNRATHKITILCQVYSNKTLKGNWHVSSTSRVHKRSFCVDKMAACSVHSYLLRDWTLNLK